MNIRKPWRLFNGIAEYHKSVADYYDEEAESLNPGQMRTCLKHLRNQFRDIVLKGEFEHLLEIGYGPGLDMVWFSKIDDVKQVSGLYITPEFYKLLEIKPNFTKK